ncbi:hypothetical protein [Mycobacterium sp. AZCC_0083]|uniref:hypothetical protein n=1 Tax=Mycobacterium sp. AZCC_0083 TaxID=2735882 RepID=UPI001614AED6|nr:hypothetical protein [Mycobacterium sp. AZCC_0083]MBB5167186.1 hypothetical protein [Mycobacterium sp. AZCC_0083]
MTTTWIGWQVGMSGPTVKTAKAKLKARFSYAKRLDDTEVFGLDLQAALVTYQQNKNADKNYTGPKLGSHGFGVLDFDTQVALGVIVIDKPAFVQGYDIVHFSINGAGSTYDMGYPYDIGELLDKTKCYHQPIGYNTAPVPMSRGVKDGVAEFIRQLDMPRGPKGENCTQIPWCATVYSMGAIVFMTVLMRVLYGDLGRFKATYRGSSAFGNPMREHGHTFPGCSYSDGEGIVTPTAHDTPVEHWDFASDKAMTNTKGDDLYSKINKAGSTADQIADMRAVWDIVNTGNPLNLAGQVWNLVSSPTFNEGVGAFKAATNALDFFLIKVTSPHTTYQFVNPIDGDPRSCWDIALQHARDIVAAAPVRR